MYSDVDKIHDGIGDKVGLLIQWIATFVGGFVVAFITDWRLTLLLVAFTPLLAIAGFAMAKVVSSVGVVYAPLYCAYVRSVCVCMYILCVPVKRIVLVVKRTVWVVTDDQQPEQC